ncbi:unnamed protein product [Protopolystoma xenopodis]|uniref:Uncharacterized protein n=1 Tax=Protopolystoma xenopodis TaxID=117903 RepID=A0A3S5ATM4_9PLAT|nr:unnamed protein product [Protopolystoma xenopodis]
MIQEITTGNLGRQMTQLEEGISALPTGLSQKTASYLSLATENGPAIIRRLRLQLVDAQSAMTTRSLQLTRLQQQRLQQQEAPCTSLAEKMESLAFTEELGLVRRRLDAKLSVAADSLPKSANALQQAMDRLALIERLQS